LVTGEAGKWNQAINRIPGSFQSTTRSSYIARSDLQQSADNRSCRLIDVNDIGTNAVEIL
jgi:hypothetical protein